MHPHIHLYTALNPKITGCPFFVRLYQWVVAIRTESASLSVNMVKQRGRKMCLLL